MRRKETSVKLTKLLLLLEEGSVEGISSRIKQKLETVEDLNRAASLDTDHAAVNPRILQEHYVAGAGAIPGGAGRGWRIKLSPNPSEVIRDVQDHQRMKLEGEAARGRRSH